MWFILKNVSKTKIHKVHKRQSQKLWVYKLPVAFPAMSIPLLLSASDRDKRV